MSFILTTLITALLRITTALFSNALAEKVMRKVLIHVLEWVVASTGNTVDDDIAKPIIDALKDGS